jgi:glycosyltransferase involved in cell wall biosynthesis
VDLAVLAGGERRDLGHGIGREDLQDLEVVRVGVAKSRFHLSPRVYARLLSLLRGRGFDAVLMPCEKKHLPVIVFLFALRRPLGFRLAAYTHPEMRSAGLRHRRLNRFLTRLMFAMYDKIVLYTEQAMREAVAKGLLPASKAAFANNTLDTESISAVYDYVPPPDEPRILFIGRLIPSKRLDLLLEYYRELKKKLPGLELVVVGDGPEAPLVREAAEKDPAVHWKGAVVDEAAIAEVMRGVQLVFLPGLSGLSIVHAFCYGRPFATIENENHGPEIAYLEDGRNGLVLSGEMDKDVQRIAALLGDGGSLRDHARGALETSLRLSIENWRGQMLRALGAEEAG